MVAVRLRSRLSRALRRLGACLLPAAAVTTVVAALAVPNWREALNAQTYDYDAKPAADAEIEKQK